MTDNVNVKGNETMDNNQFDQPYYRIINMQLFTAEVEVIIGK